MMSVLRVALKCVCTLTLYDECYHQSDVYIVLHLWIFVSIYRNYRQLLFMFPLNQINVFLKSIKTIVSNFLLKEIFYFLQIFN